MANRQCGALTRLLTASLHYYSIVQTVWCIAEGTVLPNCWKDFVKLSARIARETWVMSKVATAVFSFCVFAVVESRLIIGLFNAVLTGTGKRCC